MAEIGMIQKKTNLEYNRLCQLSSKQNNNNNITSVEQNDCIEKTYNHWVSNSC